MDRSRQLARYALFHWRIPRRRHTVTADGRAQNRLSFVGYEIRTHIFLEKAKDQLFVCQLRTQPTARPGQIAGINSPRFRHRTRDTVLQGAYDYCPQGEILRAHHFGAAPGASLVALSSGRVRFDVLRRQVPSVGSIGSTRFLIESSDWQGRGDCLKPEFYGIMPSPFPTSMATQKWMKIARKRWLRHLAR